MARPRKQIDPKVVERLARRMASKRETAMIVGCDESVLRKREDLAAAYAFGRQCGKTYLRAKQMELALRGNATMLIWLGKQYLGQADQAQLKIDSTEVPFDPVAAYANNPELLQRSLDLERDAYDASQVVDASDARPARLPGVEVSAAHSGPGSSGNGHAVEPDGQPNGRPDAGEAREERL